MPQWPDDDRDVLDVLSDLRAQGQLLAYSGGQWYALNTRRGAASPLPATDVAELDRLVEQRKGGGAGEPTIPEAVQRVIEQTGGRYAYSEAAGYYAGRAEVSPTGGLRQRGSMITAQERASLQRATEAAAETVPEAAPVEAAGGGEMIGTGEAAQILGVSRDTAAAYAAEGRFPAIMERGRWQMRRADVEEFARTRETEEGVEEWAEEEGDGAGGDGGGRGGGRGRRPGGDIGDIFGAGQDVAGAAAGGAAAITGAVVGFTQNTIETALIAAGGASGAGAARIGGAVANMVTGGVQAVAGGALAVGGAVVNLLVGGLQLVGTVAAFAIGGAILGLFVGAIAAIGTGIASAVSDVVGVVATSAQEALQGVVTVLQDLTRTGREMSQAGFGMRAIGGMAPGQELQSLLFGRALGADVGGMMSSWQMRPEFMQARFGAIGAEYDPGDVPGSMMGAAGAIRGLPSLLQYPMAGAVSGGQPEAMMRLVQMPEEQLRAAQDLAAEMGANNDLLQNIFGRLEPTLNRLSTLFLGIKLEVLGAAIPLIEVAVTGLFQLWDSNKDRVFGVIGRLPEIAGAIVNAVVRGTARTFPVLVSIYETLKGMWEWARTTLGPIGVGAARALGIDTPATRGGYAPGSPEAARAASAEGAMGTAMGVGGFVARHPWETAAAVLLGPQLLRGAGAAALRWAGGGAAAAAGGGAGAMGSAAALGLGAAIPIGAGAAGYYGGLRASQAETRGGAVGWSLGGGIGGGAAIGAGIGSLVPVIGTLIGGLLGGIIGGITATATMLDEKRKRDEAGPSLKLPDVESDPILRGARATQRYLDELAKRDFVREFKQAVVDGQREAAEQQQMRDKDLGTLKIEPSPEFAVLMEQRQAEAQFRALQLAVS